jgi:hypothetical protein
VTDEKLSPMPGGVAAMRTALHLAVERIHPATSAIWWDSVDERIRNVPEALANAEPVTAAVADALAAVAALHAFYGAPDYYARMASDSGGRTVGGLVYVRNLLAHGLHAGHVLAHRELPAREVLGQEWEAPAPEVEQLPMVAFQFRWAPFASLPTPDPAFAERHNRDVWYRQHVDGEPLSSPLHVAEDWFASQS